MVFYLYPWRLPSLNCIFLIYDRRLKKSASLKIVMSLCNQSVEKSGRFQWDPREKLKSEGLFEPEDSLKMRIATHLVTSSFRAVATGLLEMLMALSMLPNAEADAFLSDLHLNFLFEIVRFDQKCMFVRILCSIRLPDVVPVCSCLPFSR